LDFSEITYRDDYTDSEQNFASGKEIFLKTLCGHGLSSKECDEFFNLIREIGGLMAGFFAPSKSKQQFLIGALVLSMRGDRAKAGRFEDDDAAARNIRVYPSHVVNIGRREAGHPRDPRSPISRAREDHGLHLSHPL
jgi:hypothetical protein